MKLLIDINHPAHVHFFRNFALESKKAGHDIIICASKKDIAYDLLREYDMQFISVGSYGKSFGMKLFKLPVIGFRMILLTMKYKPHVLMGIASFRAAQAAWLLGKKSFIFDDTEHSTFEIMLYKPFATHILTPDCFRKPLGKKQIKYPGYHELAYLHPSRFTPDIGILNELSVQKDEPYVIIRFVGWDALHDTGRKGLSLENKRKAVTDLSKHARVFITSEKPLPADLEPYRLTIKPTRVHHAIYYATLVFGESATMASEASVLGTPAVYIDLDGRCYTDEEETRFDSVYNFTNSLEDQIKAINKGIEILAMKNVKEIWKEKRERLLHEKVDVTKWMTDLIIPENKK